MDTSNSLFLPGLLAVAFLLLGILGVVLVHAIRVGRRTHIRVVDRKLEEPSASENKCSSQGIRPDQNDC